MSTVGDILLIQLNEPKEKRQLKPATVARPYWNSKQQPQRKKDKNGYCSLSFI